MKYFIVPLVIGWFLGAASGILFMHMAHGGALMHGHGPHPMRERFARELKLTPDQRVKVNAIFEAGHQKIDAIFQQNVAPLEAVRVSTRDHIRTVLDSGQQAQFDKMDAKMAAHFKKRFEEGPDQGHP